MRRARCGPCGRPGTRRAASTSLLGLAPGGVCLAAASPRRRCALTAPFHPCRRRGNVRPRRLAVYFCGTFPRVSPGRISRPPSPCGVRTFLEAPVFSPASAAALPATTESRSAGSSSPRALQSAASFDQSVLACRARVRQLDPGRKVMASSSNGGGGDAVTLLAVGDVFLDRPQLNEAFEGVRDVFAAADVVVGNCEGTYGEKFKRAPSSAGPLLGTVESRDAVCRSGINVMGLANNHILDGGHSAMLETRDAFRTAGIATTGAGENLTAAREPAIVES